MGLREHGQNVEGPVPGHHQPRTAVTVRSEIAGIRTRGFLLFALVRVGFGHSLGTADLAPAGMPLGPAGAVSYRGSAQWP